MTERAVDDAAQMTKTATVLIVEDEILVRMAVVEDFVQAGYSVIEAASADEAITILEAGLEVDLIFSDIQMPGALDGLALLKAVRDRYPSISVILTSGQTVPPAQALDGRHFFVPKPYASRTVLDLAHQEMARRETRDEPGRCAPPGHSPG